MLAITVAACRGRDAARARDAGVHLDARPVTADIIDAAPPIDAPEKPAVIATRIVASADTTCAILSDLTVRCWGANKHGQLGNGETADSPRPVAPKVRAVVDLQLADATACALLDDASVACWGRIAWNGRAEDTLRPTGVLGVTRVQKIFVFPGRACGRLASGSLVCWGNIDAAGHFSTLGANRVPTPVVGLDHVAGMTLDGAYADDGRMWRWSRDGVPRRVEVTGVAEIASRDGALCARSEGGRVVCVDTGRCGPPSTAAGKPAAPVAGAGKPAAGGAVAGNAAASGKPGAAAGKPGAATGKPGAVAGKPGATTGKPGAATAGKPGAVAGKPGAATAGKPGAATTGKPGAVAGKPGAATAGKPGAVAGKPGAATAGKPGAATGKPGAATGKPGAVAGKPGAVAGKPGAATGKPGAASAAGDPAVAAAAVPSGEPVLPLGVAPARQLAFGLGFCAVTAAGRLQCSDGCRKPDPLTLDRVAQIVDRCAILQSKTVACFDGTKFAPIAGVRRATSLAIGRAHGCALDDGTITCWGDREHGQLGEYAVAP